MVFENTRKTHAKKQENCAFRPKNANLSVGKSKLVTYFPVPALVRIHDEKPTMGEKGQLAEVNLPVDVVQIDPEKRMAG